MIVQELSTLSDGMGVSYFILLQSVVSDGDNILDEELKAEQAKMERRKITALPHDPETTDDLIDASACQINQRA